MVYLVVCLSGTDVIYAQWTEVDSLWLQNIIEGKDSIRLNPETMRAIKEGTFLNGENPFAQPLEAPPILPITRDFRDIATQDTLKSEIDTLLPPAVALLKHLKEKDSLRIGGAFQFRLKTHEKKDFRIGDSPFAVSAGAQSLLDEHVKDGQRRGTVGGSAKMYFSLDDVLKFIFRKSERRKKKNKKRVERLEEYYPDPRRN